MNRLRHGLAASGVLFQGESLTTYRRHVRDLMAHLQPATAAEAGQIARLADAQFKLDRLRLVEQGMRRRNLGEAVKQSDAYAKLVATMNARRGVSELIATIDATAHAIVINTELRPFMQASRAVLAMLDELEDLPARAVERLKRELNALDDATDAEVVDFEKIRAAAVDVSSALDGLMKKRKALVRKYRRQLSTESLLLKNDELKLLDRYRRDLENSMTRTLAILAAFREQRPEADSSGSFGQDLQVRLKVVK